jgi:hypothetical protein
MLFLLQSDPTTEQAWDTLRHWNDWLGPYVVSYNVSATILNGLVLTVFLSIVSVARSVMRRRAFADVAGTQLVPQGTGGAAIRKKSKLISGAKVLILRGIAGLFMSAFCVVAMDAFLVTLKRGFSRAMHQGGLTAGSAFVIHNFSFSVAPLWVTLIAFVFFFCASWDSF